MVELLRAAVFHTPRDPFVVGDQALENWSDGGLLIDGPNIAALGDFAGLHLDHPHAPVRDLRGGFLLPGFIDTHVHYPQVRVLGSLGCDLLEWLDRYALPEEAKMSDQAHAQAIASIFISELAANGTTTALVFGAHFSSAMTTLFDHAAQRGPRIISGLALGDRMLRPELHINPDQAYRQSTDLIHRYHGKGNLAYAVTPRFALSSSEAMLEVCSVLLKENPGVHFTTHINENSVEIEQVLQSFPWATDYLSVYEKFGLLTRRSVFAHNLHAGDSELARMAVAACSIAHCPASNCALGSGLFKLRRHIAAGIRVALGTDVGAGTGFGMMKEAVQAYLVQRMQPDGFPLTPAHLLYLATKAGAEALELGDVTGDLAPGHSADFVYLRPQPGTALAAITKQAESAQHVLSAIFTLATSAEIQETVVRGRRVN